MTAPETTANATAPPPLEGVKVLDFSRIIAGPLCTMQLADMGANVLKVENPKTGDDSRSSTRPMAGMDSHFFQAFNKNKRSIGLDFRAGEGKEIFFKLLEEADVLMENFRPGVMTRYAKKMVRPDMYGLVVCKGLEE